MHHRPVIVKSLVISVRFFRLQTLPEWFEEARAAGRFKPQF